MKFFFLEKVNWIPILCFILHSKCYQHQERCKNHYSEFENIAEITLFFLYWHLQWLMRLFFNFYILLPAIFLSLLMLRLSHAPSAESERKLKKTSEISEIILDAFWTHIDGFRWLRVTSCQIQFKNMLRFEYFLSSKVINMYGKMSELKNYIVVSRK